MPQPVIAFAEPTPGAERWLLKGSRFETCRVLSVAVLAEDGLWLAAVEMTTGRSRGLVMEAYRGELWMMGDD